MGKITLYIHYSADECHLPVAVAESPGELARMIGRSKSAVLSGIAHRRETFARVEVEDEE